MFEWCGVARNELTRPRVSLISCSMCNRVRASFEFRESKIRWNLFNDLPELKPSHNIAPIRGDILTVVHSDAGNAGRLMYWPLIPSFTKGMQLEYSTSNAPPSKPSAIHPRWFFICRASILGWLERREPKMDPKNFSNSDERLARRTPCYWRGEFFELRDINSLPFYWPFSGCHVGSLVAQGLRQSVAGRTRATRPAGTREEGSYTRNIAEADDPRTQAGERSGRAGDSADVGEKTAIWFALAPLVQRRKTSLGAKTCLAWPMPDERKPFSVPIPIMVAQYRLLTG